MPNEVDKSLLDRLQALRGSSATPERPAPAKVEVDVIERARAPSREDALAARLKSLRSQDEISSSPTGEPSARPALEKDPLSLPSAKPETTHQSHVEKEDDVVSAFQTDDQTLEELLGDVGADDAFAAEPDPDPDDAKIKALLEELSQSVPRDEEGDRRDKDKDNNLDGSDDEDVQGQVDNVIARFRDEIEVEAAYAKHDPPDSSEHHRHEPDNEPQQASDLALPSVPTDLASPDPNVPSPSSIDDITARLSALRASPSPAAGLDLPSVPTSKPAKAPRRLESRTSYTDDDVDSWCTVCLDDATLMCLGCSDEGDPYCARCWREMHVGPAAAFDDRDHKAVHFSKAQKKDNERRVALGA